MDKGDNIIGFYTSIPESLKTFNIFGRYSDSFLPRHLPILKQTEV